MGHGSPFAPHRPPHRGHWARASHSTMRLGWKRVDTESDRPWRLFVLRPASAAMRGGQERRRRYTGLANGVFQGRDPPRFVLTQH